MKRALVIGYGNPLRGDDGVGWLAAEQLADAAEDDRIELLPRHQLTPELAEPISRAERVIFIDACAAGTPGSWNCQEVAPEPKQSAPVTHHFNPQALLAYAQALFNASPQAFLISIAAGSFHCGEGLTPPVRAALAEVIAYVHKLLAQPAATSKAGEVTVHA